MVYLKLVPILINPTTGLSYISPILAQKER